MKGQLIAALLCLLAMQGAANAQTLKPRPGDKNLDGSPKYATYEDYIEALVDWKLEKRIEELRKIDQNAPAGLPTKATSPGRIPVSTASTCSSAIDSQIDGDFNGWDGETIYRLTNGQIWRQSSYHYHYHYAYSPHVLIFASDLGCKIAVRDDDDDPVYVERIK